LTPVAAGRRRHFRCGCVYLRSHCHFRLMVGMYGFVRCFSRPPDNLGAPLQLREPGRNPFAPSVSFSESNVSYGLCQISVRHLFSVLDGWNVQIVSGFPPPALRGRRGRRALKKAAAASLHAAASCFFRLRRAQSGFRASRR
jgi:hypothetical protein